MIVYIALLRGINVGGKNVIKMAELKKVFEAIGLCDVKTYIQSGNVLFKSNQGEEFLRGKIEHEIKAVFGFPFTVILRTSAELEQLVSNCPFSAEELADAEASTQAESQYVALLTHLPLQENIALLDAYREVNDQYRIIGRDVFLLFNHSIRNSKLATNLYKLGVSATVRNWKTLNKLTTLAKAMD
ncbi:DUF1697 domain-containing protein [Desulfosporosinus hippei]|uniref:Uncharacterized conserved protein, DUF1697 family n=1 Tax=Desulfosporosinus hippei DSM 8344 TaxID=1121419 RepID=A0A1G7YI02_9FIRM|nr:DUF1697 domain-containing protein [Desulfosporosinus hippei]SDG95500.1 Uncharacterized conserved protein, DUF1697 family [Desulfosporosinus hippei DSM 8344]